MASGASAPSAVSEQFASGMSAWSAPFFRPVTRSDPSIDAGPRPQEIQGAGPLVIGGQRDPADLRAIGEIQLALTVEELRDYAERTSLVLEAFEQVLLELPLHVVGGFRRRYASKRGSNGCLRHRTSRGGPPGERNTATPKPVPFWFFFGLTGANPRWYFPFTA